MSSNDPLKREAKEIELMADQFADSVAIQDRAIRTEDAGNQQSPSSLGGAMDLLSGLVAAKNSRKTCPTHERCDGSCTGTKLSFQPLQSEFAIAQVHASPAPAVIPDGATARNLA